MDLSIEGAPEDQVRRPHERPKVRRQLTVDEIVARVSRLNLERRDEAARLIREDRDR